MYAIRSYYGGFDVDLEKTARLALFHRARDARHRALRDQRLDAFALDLGGVHADAPERRVDEQAVDRHPVGPLAIGAREQVVGDDLVVVVRGVGERALAVAIAERPDMLVRRAQAAVDGDGAAAVGFDAGLV